MLRKSRLSLSKQFLKNRPIIINFIQIMIGTSNPKRKLQSGNEIPYIGYGTYQLKGNDCDKGVRWALQAGYTHIDTASIYKNQDVIGKVLKELNIQRNHIYITSKISPSEQGYGEAKKACQQILQRLGTPYLDLLIIHWPGVFKQDSKSPKNKEIRRETWRALVELKKEGKVKDIGVSNYLKHHLQDLIAHSDVKPAINQFQIHPLLWQRETIDFCRQHNIAIEAYSPLARNHQKLFNNELMQNLADKYKKTIAQICLRWGYQHNFIILPKSANKARIVQNFQIFDFELSPEDMKWIDSLTKSKVRTCWDPNSIIH